MDDWRYLIFEHRLGATANERLAREGPFPLDRARDVARAFGGALTALHQRGLIHRAVRPDVVVVPDERPPLVMDVGLTQGSVQRLLADPNEPPGAICYLAPEVLQGAEPDARSDLYALGATLFELLTGEPPYRPRALHELMYVLAASVAPPDLRALRPDVPAPVAELVSQLLQPDPAGRPTSSEEVTARL